MVLGTVAAALVAAVLRLLATAVSGPLLVTGRGAVPVEVTTGPILLAVAAGGAAPWLLARLSTRTRRPRRAFLAYAAVGLVMSVVPTLSATTTAGTLWLIVLHVGAAACLVPLVVATLPAGRREPQGPPARPDPVPAADV